MVMGWLFGMWIGIVPAHAASLEISLPVYQDHRASEDRQFTSGVLGLKLEGITQWVSVQGVSLSEDRVVVNHLSAYVHARQGEVVQKGERLAVSRSRRWWVPLPRFDWKPFRRLWASVSEIGVHLSLKRPVTARVENPIELELVQTNKGLRTLVRNPERLEALLRSQVRQLLHPDHFLDHFTVDVYGFGYPADPLLNRAWKRVQSPLLSLARRQVEDTWIPRVVERVSGNRE